MSEEKQLKDIAATLERVLQKLDVLEKNQNDLHRAVFGDEVSRTKPLRTEMLEMDEKLDEITTWLDRVKWVAGTLGITNFGAWILAWIGIKT